MLQKYHLFLLKQIWGVPKILWKGKKMLCLLLYLVFFLDLHTHSFGKSLLWNIFYITESTWHVPKEKSLWRSTSGGPAEMLLDGAHRALTPVLPQVQGFNPHKWTSYILTTTTSGNLRRDSSKTSSVTMMRHKGNIHLLPPTDRSIFHPASLVLNWIQLVFYQAVAITSRAFCHVLQAQLARLSKNSHGTVADIRLTA